MTNSRDRRADKQCQMLVDVAIVLERAHGSAYARGFMEEMAIGEEVINRVLLRTPTRRMMHLPEISADH